MCKKKMALLGAILSATVVAATPASAITIVLNPTANFSSAPNGAAALQAFQVAANYWSTTLVGDAVLRFNVDYRNLGDPNIIGSTGSTRTDIATSAVYGALATHQGGQLDSIAVANLVPLTAAGGVGYRMPPPSIPATGLGIDTVAGSVFDNNDSYNNTVMYANTSTLKALGLFTGNPNASDASITFNSTFAFDYNPLDGIGVGLQDFTAVAVHEMGHALGFVSGTDFYDQYGNPNGPSKAVGDTIDWQDESVLSVWDLFRRSTNPPSNAGFDPTGKRYIQLDPNRGAGFSIDGVNFFNQQNGTEAEFGNLSTGRYNGDGQQASHWKDAAGFFDQNGCFISNRQIGIMDPTSGTCQMGIVTSNDLGAFDAMGYNLNFNILDNLGYTFTTAQMFQLAGISGVPEPTSWAMMIGGFGLIGGAMRRSAKPAAVAA